MSIFICLIFICLTTTPIIILGKPNKLLLVSFDGFRWDYLNKYNLPEFNKFAKSGVKVPHVVNNFPTKTFPSHVTISTGLFSESHGIVANRMYDPIFKEFFTLGCRACQTDPKWWKTGEPIWITAKRNKLKSGVLFWPGSETTYEGYSPDEKRTYNKSLPFHDRVDLVVNWLTRLDMVALYFHEPDATGHTFGPDSPEVNKTLLMVDSTLKYLVQKLNKAGLTSSTNVILTSDHGMFPIPKQNQIDLSGNHLNMTLIDQIVDDGIVLMINAKDGKEHALHQHLVALSSKFGHMTVYNKSNTPSSIHFKLNVRITDFTVIADEGYYLKVLKNYTSKASHGYLPKYNAMWPFFMAKGPDFKTNYLGNAFKQEDIYPLMTRLLGIPSSPNNGSISRVIELLSGHGSRATPTHSFIITLSSVSFLFLFI